MTDTLNTRALRLVQKKIGERLEKIKGEAFESENFPDFKRYVGMRDGLDLALHLCEEVETELNS